MRNFETRGFYLLIPKKGISGPKLRVFHKRNAPKVSIDDFLPDCTIIYFNMLKLWRFKGNLHALH